MNIEIKEPNIIYRVIFSNLLNLLILGFLLPSMFELKIVLIPLVFLSILLLFITRETLTEKYFISHISIMNDRLEISYSIWGKRKTESVRISEISTKIVKSFKRGSVYWLIIQGPNFKIKQFTGHKWNLELFNQIVNKSKCEK
jgi:hypothetical protein